MHLDRAAIARAFLAEAEQRLGRMEEALLALQGTPTHPDIVEGILRDVRSIQGHAVMLGHAALADTVETFGEIVEGLQTGALPITSEITSRLLDGIHGLRDLVSETVIPAEDDRARNGGPAVYPCPTPEGGPS